MAFLKRGGGGGGKGSPPLQAEDPDFQGTNPVLFEFLTLLRWEDGTPRKSGTILITVEDAMWRCWVHDRDGKRSAWVSGLTFADLMDAVERGLRDDAVGWRLDKK